MRAGTSDVSPTSPGVARSPAPSGTVVPARRVPGRGERDSSFYNGRMDRPIIHPDHTDAGPRATPSGRSSGPSSLSPASTPAAGPGTGPSLAMARVPGAVPSPDSPDMARSPTGPWLTSRARQWLPPALVLLALTGIWEAWVGLRGVQAWLLPPPSAIGRALVEDRALLATHGRVTLVEVLLGFALAVVAGVALGAAIDASATLRRALYPLVVASQTIPLIALAPLFLIWFGYGLLPKILVTALIAFFPITVGTVDGLRATDEDTRDLFRSLDAGRWAYFRFAKVPAALPAILSGVKVAVAVSVIGAVFGELFGSSEGLGYLLQRSMSQFLTARVFATIAVLSAMGVLLFLAVSAIERWLIPWRRMGDR